MKTIHSHSSERSRRRGSALLMAVLVMLSLLAMAAALIQVNVSANREVSSRMADTEAFFLAESMVNEALLALRAGGTGNVGSVETPTYLGGGLAWVESTDLGDGRRRLLACAMRGSGRSALEIVVSGDAGPALFPFSVASLEDIQIDTLSVLDSFDSSAGTYQDQLGAGSFVDEGIVVQSNGYIKVKAGAIIHGDAAPGPGEIVALDSGTVTGSTASMAEPFTLPAAVMPAVPTTGIYELPAGGVGTLTAGVYSFDHLKLGDSAQLTVEGPTTLIVYGQFEAKSGSEMIFASNGQPVEIFVAGTMSMGAGSILRTPSEDAALVSMNLLGADQTCEINADGLFYGTIYGPDCYVKLKASMELMGALACRLLALDSGAKVHYDTRLGGGSAGSEGAYQILSWQRSPVPAGTVLADRQDPFLVLGVNKDDLSQPSDAWEMPQPE